MTIKIWIKASLMILICGCSQVQPSKDILTQTPLINVAARYNPELLGTNLVLNIQNMESYEVCFSSTDLEPGYGRTFVRDSRNAILNDEVNPALEILRGINVAPPIVVLRVGQTHSEWIDVSEFVENNETIIVQTGMMLFRCSDLFDSSVSEVDVNALERAFRL